MMAVPSSSPPRYTLLDEALRQIQVRLEATRELGYNESSNHAVRQLITKRYGRQLTPTERGTINGVTFARSRWSGYSLEWRSAMHGFVYISKSGNIVLRIVKRQSEANRAKIRYTDAAVLTFRKK